MKWNAFGVVWGFQPASMPWQAGSLPHGLAADEPAHFARHLLRLRHKGEMPAIRQAHQQGLGNAGTELTEASVRHENVSRARQNQGGNPYSFEAATHVELFYQLKTMCH